MSESKVNKNTVKKVIKQDKRIATLKKLLVYYKEITETVREPFIILDKKLCVVTANSSFYRKFKVLKKDTEGKLIYELGNNQWDSPELRRLLENILPKHRVFNNFLVSHDFPSIGRRMMLLNARQVDSKQLILLAMEDITDKLKLISDSNEMTANLIKQRDRLQGLSDAKDEFVSLASHQLRTPATAVKQYVGMLREGYGGHVTKEQKNMLNIVYENNERQLEIIEDLLRVARIDAGKVYLDKSPSDMVKQIEKAIEGQAVLFKSRNQTIVFNKPKNPIIALIDRKLMLMVLENILDNAGKYSREGKKVTIGVRQNKNFTIVTVKDYGVGVRNKDLKKLFKKFSRIDNPLSESVKGTGLGLYWAQNILELHGGTIEATSKLNAGSVFTIKIPISTAKSPKKTPLNTT